MIDLYKSDKKRERKFLKKLHKVADDGNIHYYDYNFGKEIKTPHIYIEGYRIYLTSKVPVG